MATFWQTLRGSFSAVSKPNFASKYSLESSWRDLQDLHVRLYTYASFGYTLLHRSAFKISAKFRQTFSHVHNFILIIWLFFSKMLSKIHEFGWTFSWISQDASRKMKWPKSVRFSNFLRFCYGNCRISKNGFRKLDFFMLEKRY